MEETLLAICLGVALSAACGFRVFIPPFVMSASALLGGVDLPASADWMENPAAFAALGAATLVEVAGFYIPWVDNLLDTVATPAAIVAGTLITGSFAPELDPVLRWTMAGVLGGGAAGGIQTLTSLTRLASTTTTGGIGNPVFSTLENILAVVFSLLAFALPLIAIAALIALTLFAVRRVAHLRHPRQGEHERGT